MKIEEFYQKARVIPSFRQAFLDGIDLGEYERYISRVKYISEKSLLGILVKDSGGMGNFQLNPLGWFMKGIKSLVLVDEKPFSQLENPYDFIGCLLYHEGDHAKQGFERGQRLTRREREFFEALAWTNQYRNMDFERCSKDYKALVFREFSRRAKFLQLTDLDEAQSL